MSGFNADENMTTKLSTPANIVTIIRILAIFAWLLIVQLFMEDKSSYSLLSISNLIIALLYIFISATDSLDGYLARSRREITNFGIFLDPIADKLVVIVAMLVLMQLGFVNIWVITIVVTREFIVSALRMVIAAKGVVLPAGWLGKWKTATTMIAICGYFLFASFSFEPISSILYWLSFSFMFVAVVLTVWSGIDYIVKCWKYII